MKNSDQWIEEIDGDILELKKRGKRWYFQINAKMSRESSGIVESFFKTEGYNVEMRKCNSCKNNYDIIIGW